MEEIKGNDVKFKDSLKINFLGVAILKQDFVFEHTYKTEWKGKSTIETNYNDTIYTHSHTIKHKVVQCSDLPSDETHYRRFAEKPKYHCYLLLDIGSILSQPIIFWSMEYKTERSVREMIELCNNTAKAVMKKRTAKKTTVMANVIADFKLKYGKEKIPIRMITADFAVKKHLPGIAREAHRNQKQFI
jgi:hypothetical protein